MLGANRSRLGDAAAIVASAGVPAVTWLQLAGLAGEQALVAYLAGGAAVVLVVSTVPSRRPASEPLRERAAAAVLVLLYPGLLVSYVVRIAVTRLFPLAVPFGVAAALGLGAAVGTATIAGDLVESGLKRAAAVKHSGRHIPGRGGVMDSIDSILLGAPVFYAVVA